MLGMIRLYTWSHCCTASRQHQARDLDRFINMLIPGLTGLARSSSWFLWDWFLENIEFVLSLDDYLQVSVPVHEVGVVKLILLKDRF
ncbi:hypothetical protein L1987_43208 [Smallanthus sonchifolius]|uniref:Uncharacterized protein n=1 Tax=Smallanthus sonchifolius TaxID=185202 RepID=A0ACB9GLQ1_9ASTR|nr:hypothetical protein L1987_43208 [Smallanthus sonchifolius]